jgi:1-acyl-sn-glycerol-3-phosphate acyltransferase
MADTPRQDGTASRLIYALLRISARIVIPLVARVHTDGMENVPRSGPVILAVNHIHWTDIPMIAVRVPRITHFMAKSELFRKPVLGGLIRMLGAFPVRRGEGDREAIRTTERLLAEGEVCAIFPEGHRSESGALIPAHPGAGYVAVRTGAPVVAIGVQGTKRVFKGLRYGPFRPTVTIRYSRPFTVGTGGKVSKEEMVAATDEIMHQIAALLPPEQRGPYGETPRAVPTPDAAS